MLSLYLQHPGRVSAINRMAAHYWSGVCSLLLYVRILYGDSSIVSHLFSSVLTLHAFFMRRTQFAQFLTANPTLTANRYLRLMGLASVEILFTIPIATYGMILNITLYPIQPWISWADTHFNYSQVNLYPAVLWRISRIAVISIELSRALPILCAFLFFLFFGFAEEARRNYKKGWNRTTSLFKECLRLKRNSVSERYVLT